MLAYCEVLPDCVRLALGLATGGTDDRCCPSEELGALAPGRRCGTWHGAARRGRWAASGRAIRRRRRTQLRVAVRNARTSCLPGGTACARTRVECGRCGQQRAA